MRQPNSLPQDRGNPQPSYDQAIAPDPLPPDVKVIECSCALAENRSPDNSKWVNIIKEPFEVAKGSEIRVMSNFIDMRGINPEIIQFQSTGPQQDNSHTFLTQLYTTNDGYNNKTTSYDYMSINDKGFIITDPGENYPAGVSYTTSAQSVTGSGTGAECFKLIVKPYGIRPKNVEITSSGSGYRNGDPFTITSGSDDFTGFILTDDVGSIKKLIFTKSWSNSNPTNPNQLNLPSDNRGSGATLSITISQNVVSPDGISDNRTDTERGTGYRVGDIIAFNLDNTSNPISIADQAQAMIDNVFIGKGQVNKQAYFDQGYNYEKTPVYRWSQTFDFNQSYVYGGNTGNRTFKSHDQSITIPDENSHQINDPCLSASNLILNKEDEFASGIYHTKNNNDTFYLNAPVLNFNGADQSSGVFRLEASTTNDSWYLSLANNPFPTTTINGKTIQTNVLNTMPIGGVYQLQFEYTNIANPTTQNLEDLAVFTDKWATTFRVKDIDPQAGIIEISTRFSDYVGKVNEFQFGSQRSPPSTYPIDQLIELNMVYEGCDEPNGSPPTQNPIIEIGTDGNGQWNGNFNIRSDQAGVGVRPGMTFTIDQTQYPGALEKIVITQVDATNGWAFPVSRDAILVNDELFVTTNGTPEPLSMFIVPVQNHSELVTEDNSPFDTIIENKGNRIGFRYDTRPPTIGSVFPSTINTSIIGRNSSDASIGLTSKASNGLYRNQGQLISSDVYFKPKEGALVNHDTETSFDVSSNTFLTTATIPYGPTGIFQPFGNISDPNSPWWQNTANNNKAQLRLDQSQWDATGYKLPLNTYIVIIGNEVGVKQVETHVQTGGLDGVANGYYFINIISQDVEYNNRTLTQLSSRVQTSLALGFDSLPPGIVSNDNNLNGTNINEAILIYTPDPKNHNTQITTTWDNITGSLAITGDQNFFNTNDPNYPNIQNDPIITQTSLSLRSTYNKGGYYFLSQLTGRLSTQEGTANDYDLTSITKNVFNQGFDFWNFAQLPSKHYEWRSDYQSPNSYNFQQSVSNITKLWDYYPLYRQKTFTIDKSFCVASDISGIWTRSAHALTGAIDPTSGNEYVDKTRTGILQNEFIMPVYGSNNRILPSGEYEKLPDVYPDTNGLEPGHMVGINYVTSNNNWLAGSLQVQLPKDENNNSFYYVFFRTTWTHMRGYDPLKSDTTNPALPDRRPLETTNTTADKIGNANNPGQTTKKALNGDTMIVRTNDPSAQPPTTNPEPSAYELGTAGGVAPGGTPVRFGERNFYPIYYLDEGLRDQFPKAKISQYIGSQNLTLAFATDISTFTFQFLHNPYTSPFVEGQGGDNAIRVFFGNRKDGIFNHETLGGVVVVNYCRPDFPKNTFTLTEITNNPTFGNNFPFGINPLISTGSVGRSFLNKLGFTDQDLGIAQGKIQPDNKQLNIVLNPFTRDITLLTDGSVGSNTYQINSYDATFYGTTGSDLDSSDAILTSIPAPEINAGLESYNQEVIPEVGKSSKLIRKFGDFIFYPYSLNNDTNSFEDTAIVRFDNASSTYGAVGGLLLSNSNRGMGLPNTTGSTFITDQNTIPRTLNPDCELYLAQTIACSSSLKQASLLPVKLTNAYLIILSSLMREANLYMPSAGFVNAMSVVNKTFITGDFILSQGQMSFYAKESFILSQIETEIKDTQFTSPSTLGVNSTIIYQITNYNPQPKPQLPTIQQMQDQDLEIMNIIDSHIGYLQNKTLQSPLEALNRDLYSLGLNAITNPDKLDVISAIRNQINTHDLVNLTPKDRINFLRSDEGQILLQNTADLNAIHQQVSNISEARNDFVGSGLENQIRQENITRNAEREIKARDQAIRDRTPLIYFQPPIPVREQIPPVRSLEDVDLREISPENFRSAIPLRYINYLDYKEQAVFERREPKSFLEFQQFQYGNVLQPDRPMKDIDKQFLADVETTPAGDKELYNRAIRDMNPDLLERPAEDRIRSAYEFLPNFARGPTTNPQFQREVEAFGQDVRSGRADLSAVQREILGDLAQPLNPDIGANRVRTIDKYRQYYSKNKDLIDKVFLSEEERSKAEQELKDYDDRIKGLTAGKIGSPSKQIQAQKRAIQRERQDYIKTLRSGEQTYPEPNREILMSELYRPETEETQQLAQELVKPLPRGRPAEEDIQRRQQLREQLTQARDQNIIEMGRDRLEAEAQRRREVMKREPRSITLPPRLNVPDEGPLNIPLTDTSTDKFVYRATRVPDEGYYKEPDDDDPEFDDDTPSGTFKDPVEVGLTGTKRPIQNKLFGDNSVFAGETPEAAQRFIYEMLPRRKLRGTWDILKINVKDLDVVSFPELGQEMASKITERYREPPKLKTMPQELVSAWKDFSNAYSENVAGPRGNLEHIIRGPIAPNRVELYSRQTYTQEPTNIPEYQRVKGNMRQTNALREKAEAMTQEAVEKEQYAE